MKKIKSNTGFTLIEVLVAVVVLAVGLLGLAALQTTTLNNNQSAYFRSMATQYAYDISDRMRSNRAGVTAGNYNNGAAAQHGASNDCTTASCTPAQLAGVDLFEWNVALQQLPAGVGIVCLDATPDDGTAAAPTCSNNGTVYAVKIWWDDTRSGNPDQSFVMSFLP